MQLGRKRSWRITFEQMLWRVRQDRGKNLQKQMEGRSSRGKKLSMAKMQEIRYTKRYLQLAILPTSFPEMRKITYS